MALSERHLTLLRDRGLDEELLVRLGVESSLKLGPDSIAIPYFRGGKAVNHKYRSLAGEKRFAQDPDAPKIFWNWDAIADETLASEPLIITEGEFDAIIAIQCGFQRTVSVPDGAPAQEIGAADTRKYLFLDTAPQALRDVKEIILATDGDGPGANLMNDLALRLGKGRCKFVTYPQSRDRSKRFKDLNEVYLEHGHRGVVETLSRAQWIKISGLYRMSELPPLSDPTPHDIGIPGLEKHYKVRAGDLCVITGIPGHGKTTFVNEVVGRLALKGWNACFASFEQRPQTDHRRALRTLYNGRWVIHQHEIDIQTADRWIDERFSFIVPDEDEDASLDWLLERLGAAVVQYGASVAVIDPWNELDHIRPKDMSLTEYVSESIRRLKRFAVKFQIHLIVVAHPAKMARGKDGKFPVPALYDISDSAHWYNKPDVGVIIHRLDDVTTLIRVAKAKFEVIGVRGDIYGSFNVDTGRYMIIDDPRAAGVEAV